MNAPVLQGRAFAFMSFLQKLAKGHMGHIDPLPLTHDEIHGNIQRVLGIVFKCRSVGKGKWQQATAALVRLGPDVAAHGHKTVQTAV